MQPTEKLYEADAFTRRFTAAVLACEPVPGGWRAALDRTAFYPEGGGQPCDTGTLGGAAVTGVHASGGVIWHTLDAPLPVGGRVEGELDWARRRDHMEQHTGEHILSGTLHRLFGAENVGFHIGQPAVRMDMDRPLTPAQLAEAEAAANAAVRADAPVRAWYPEPGELAGLAYRSKKELDGRCAWSTRAGADLCACCGTHLGRTGQVGLIKILSAQNYKGGVRLAVACGARAQQAVAAAWADAEAVGALLSAGPGRLAEAARPRAGRRRRNQAAPGRVAKYAGRGPGRRRRARAAVRRFLRRHRRRRPAPPVPGPWPPKPARCAPCSAPAAAVWPMPSPCPAATPALPPKLLTPPLTAAAAARPNSARAASPPERMKPPAPFCLKPAPKARNKP